MRKGRVVLLVGNSGSGKDTLIQELVRTFPGRFCTTKRFITKPLHPSEDFIPVSKEEFDEMLSNNNFFLHWESYGYHYGVSREVLEKVDQGFTVLVNVSRQVVEEGKEFPFVKSVFVRVPFEVTKERILSRGRESSEEVSERLNRALLLENYSGADFIVDNSGDLNNAVEQFAEVLGE
jgi:ribose 1,5-bisphosphokinase